MKIISKLIICVVLLNSTYIFGQTELFSVSNSKKTSIANKLASGGELLTPKLSEIENLYKSEAESLFLSVPFEDNDMLVKLQKRSITKKNFRVVESDGNGKEHLVNYEVPHSYIGSIDGKAKSTASFTVFDNKIVGLLADNMSNISISSLGDSATSDYLIGRDIFAKDKRSFSCLVEDDVTTNTKMISVGQSFAKKGTSVGRPIGIYFECDYKMYQDFGYNTTNVVNYVLSFFNEVATIYLNENIVVQVAEIKV